MTPPITPFLDALGLLSPLDRAALAAYCQTYSRWVAAETAMQGLPLVFKSPSGYPQQSPWLSIANKQLEILARYLAEFGLSPSSRQRLDQGDAQDRLAWRREGGGGQAYGRGHGTRSGAEATRGDREWQGDDHLRGVVDPMRPWPRRVVG